MTNKSYLGLDIDSISRQLPDEARLRPIGEHGRIRADGLILSGIILVCFVTRLFSEKLGWLPGWTNFLDYPLLVVFAVYVLLSLRKRRISVKPSGFAPLIWGLFMIFGVSALANVNRLHLGAVTLFFVGLFEPLAYMALAYALAPRQEVLKFLVKVLQTQLRRARTRFRLLKNVREIRLILLKFARRLV